VHAPSIILALALIGPLQCMFAQGRAFSDARLPADSIELKPNDAPATSKPWQLPKPGDLLYDPAKEAQIKEEKNAKVKGNSCSVHVFERGVFKGYETLNWGRPPEPPAKKMGSGFTPNPDLPSDAVELSSSEQPDKSDYFPTRPETRSPNVPPDFILVRVFQGKTFIGWTYMSKKAVTQLHNPKKS
jgi:hypothetical protein